MDKRYAVYYIGSGGQCHDRTTGQYRPPRGLELLDELIGTRATAQAATRLADSAANDRCNGTAIHDRIARVIEWGHVSTGEDGDTLRYPDE